MVDAAQLEDLLHRLAQRFEDAAQAPEHAPEARGWGQFLDAPRRHRQVGPYGTSAGMIVLALAGRGIAGLATQVANLLRECWMGYLDQEGYYHQRFVQTLRLAFLNLAFRLSGVSSDDGLCAEVQDNLLGRLLPSGMWGNYWISETLHDPTPRVFPSSIALLSFSLLREDSSPLDERLVSVADRLEQKLTVVRDLPLLETAAASTAILTLKGTSVCPMAVGQVGRIARSKRPGLQERGLYFYDYEHSPDGGGEPFFGRDYFFVPTEMLIGISGFQSGAPSELRLVSEAILMDLIENLRQNNGAYRPGVGERLSSLDQAWAALLLKAASLEHKPPGRFQRVVYALRRHREGNWFTDMGLPVLSMVVVTVANVLAKDAGTVESVLAAIALLIIGGMYGPTVIRKFFLGQ